MPIKHDNIFYISNISKLGGVETYVYELAKKYQDYDIAVVCKKIADNQLARLSRICPVYKHTNQRIQCKKIIINYDNDILDYVDDIKNVEVCETIHADYCNEYYQWYPVIDKRVDRWLGITKYICKTFSDKFEVKTELCYNPLNLEHQIKPLILVSATRLSKIKGKERMEKLCKALERQKIPYIWFIFTNDIGVIDNPNIIWREPTLDIRKYMLMADYGVLLSSSEACSYMINEFLGYGKPMILTPLPYLEEIGYKDGKTGYTVEFDCSNVDEVAKKMVNIPSFNIEIPKDNYDSIIVKSKSKYKGGNNMKYLVRCTVGTFKDYGGKEVNKTNPFVKRLYGDEWEVDKARYEYLAFERELVELVSIIEEEKVEEPKNIDTKEEVKPAKKTKSNKKKANK